MPARARFTSDCGFSLTGSCFGLIAALLLGASACGDDDPDNEETPAAGASAGRDGAAAGTGPSRAGMSGTAGEAAGSAAHAGRSGSGGRAARAGEGGEPDDDAGMEPDPPPAASGSFVALSYNVAGLPEGLSSSMPARFTPLIGPLLNGYELVLLQESWQTPVPNPLDPLRGYHEILVAAADHAYKTPPAEQPFGNDPRRPSALLGDGLNVFSRFPLGETTRVAWATCVDTDSDCLALKGFSMTTAEFAEGVPVHIYDLHMEAGISEEDDVARDGGIDQLLEFIDEHSQDTALIIGGDFNLGTDHEPAASQFARLLTHAGVSDACTELDCEDPGSIDKFLYRGSARVDLQAERWQRETEVFVSDLGEPLSDHPPIAVHFAWSTD